jgi:plasmid stabilization system protein ParE
MAYRLTGQAAAQINNITTETVQRFGIVAARRYYQLMLTAFGILCDRPFVADRSKLLPSPELRAYPLALARSAMPPDERVSRPQHFVIYRVGQDGVADVLGLAHDRLLSAPPTDGAAVAA